MPAYPLATPLPKKPGLSLSAQWARDPGGAFQRFVATPEFPQTGASRCPTGLPVRTSSAQVYTFMFSRYLSWLRDQGTAGIFVWEADAPAITAFLNAVEASATSEIRWRYLRLLERVYEHLIGLGLLVTNPVSEVVMARIDRQGRKAVTGQDAPMTWMSAEGQQLLTGQLAALASSEAWKGQRDAALAAILVGAGLKLSEALALHTTDVARLEGLTILDISKGLGTGKARRTPLLEFAVPFVGAWHDVRNTPRGARVLFPGTRESSVAMDPATAYRRIRKVVESAGLNPGHLGGRTLRNSYALALLAGGMAPDRVGTLLGLQEDKSINRYLKASRPAEESAGAL